MTAGRGEEGRTDPWGAAEASDAEPRVPREQGPPSRGCIRMEARLPGEAQRAAAPAKEQRPPDPEGAQAAAAAGRHAVGEEAPSNRAAAAAAAAANAMLCQVLWGASGTTLCLPAASSTPKWQHQEAALPCPSLPCLLTC